MSLLTRFGPKTAGTFPSVWLYKADPQEYGLPNLESEVDQTDIWDGVRNHVAKKNMMAGKMGDLVLFYHSNSKKETGIVGVCEIVKEYYDDPTAKDPSSKYYDAKWKKKDTGECVWKSVDIKLVEKWDEPVTLIQLKEEKENNNKVVSQMQLFTTARLSVQKVAKEALEEIERLRLANMARAAAAPADEDAGKASAGPARKKQKKA
jgi:predicted RNA-binding protein with PUA-like domain